MNFTKDAEQLLVLIGGNENIAALSHCMTRMRFVLKDETIAKNNLDKIEQLPSVKGIFSNAGQFQVIIGNKVSDFHQVFTQISSVQTVDKNTLKLAAKSKQSLLQQAMANISEIFAPIIPALIVGGLILGFRNVIGDIKLFNSAGEFDFHNATLTLIQVSQFFAGLHSFLWLIGEAIFFFLPVGIVWSITRKMGGTEILGIVLGITLVSPQLLNAYGAADALAKGTQPFWDFGLFKIDMIGYQAQVIPAILSGLVLVYLERFFKKITPAVVSMIVVPFCSLTIAVVIAHTIVGPLGWLIGGYISSVVFAGLTSQFNVIFAGIFGFLYAPLVITGFHHTTNAIDLELIAQYNGTLLWPMIALSNIAQGSAVLGMALLQRKNTKAKELNYSTMISCYLGVTEPAMFGVNIKYRFPFFAALVGSSLAAMVSVGFGVKANSIGVGGIPGILSIQLPYWSIFAIAMLIAIIVPAVLVILFGKKKGIK